MRKITRRLEFDAAHRLLHHKGKCANLHGHRYVVEVEIGLLGELPAGGLVMDFGDIKEKFGGWIEANLDHTFICNSEDRLAIECGSRLMRNKQLYVMDCEPSAENLARLLLIQAQRLLDDDHRKVTRVVVRETPNAWAEDTGEHDQ